MTGSSLLEFTKKDFPYNEEVVIMVDYTPKWHKELEIFSRVKPLIMLEGNVLDSYQYPKEGSISRGTILRLTDYLHYLFKDSGYKNIVFFDSLTGFYNNCEEGYLDSFASIVLSLQS